jgi:hypothetical protein
MAPHRHFSKADILHQRDLWIRRIYPSNMEQEREEKLSHGTLLVWRKTRAPDGQDWDTLRPSMVTKSGAIGRGPVKTKGRPPSHSPAQIDRLRGLWALGAYASDAELERVEGLRPKTLCEWKKKKRPDGKDWDEYRRFVLKGTRGEEPEEKPMDGLEGLENLGEQLGEDEQLEEGPSDESLTDAAAAALDELAAAGFGLGEPGEDEAEEEGQAVGAAPGRAERARAGAGVTGPSELQVRRATPSRLSGVSGESPSELQVRQATTRLAHQLLNLVNSALSGGEFYARPLGHANRIRLKVVYDALGNEVPLGVVRLTKSSEIVSVIRLANTVTEANFKAIRGLEEAEERVEARVIRTVQSLGDYLELTERQYHLLAEASLEGGVPRKTKPTPAPAIPIPSAPVFVPEPLPALPVAVETPPEVDRPPIPGGFKWKREQARIKALEELGGDDA